MSYNESSCLVECFYSFLLSLSVSLSVSQFLAPCLSRPRPHLLLRLFFFYNLSPLSSLPPLLFMYLFIYSKVDHSTFFLHLFCVPLLLRYSFIFVWFHSPSGSGVLCVAFPQRRLFCKGYLAVRASQWGMCRVLMLSCFLVTSVVQVIIRHFIIITPSVTMLYPNISVCSCNGALLNIKT